MLLRIFISAAVRRRRSVVAAFCAALALGPLVAADAPRKEFHIPAGDAATTLSEFARQSGEQIVFLVDNVRGQRTKAVDGELTSLEVLQLMLVDTHLAAHRDSSTGAMTVVRRPEPRPEEKRKPPPKREAAALPPRDEVVKMTEFTVSSTAADRYRATDAISAVRVRAPLLDTPSSITVLTRDLIDNIGIGRIFDVTQFVAGIQDGRGITFQDRQIIRGFENVARTVDNFVQGQGIAGSAGNYDETLIERIEVTKGPNAILSPAGAPGGSINVITKSPQYVPRRSITALVGLFDAQKLTLDLTGPVSPGSPWAYRLIVAGQDSRRYWTPDMRIRSKVLAPELSYQISDHTQVTFKIMATDHWIFREQLLILDPSAGINDTPFLAPGFSTRSRNGIQPWSHVGIQEADATMLLTSDLNEHVSVRLAADAHHYYETDCQEFLNGLPSFSNRYNPYTGILTQDYSWALNSATGRYESTYSPFFSPTAIPVRGDVQRTVTTSVTAQGDLAATYKLGAVRTQTIAGWAVGHANTVNRVTSGTLPSINLTQPAVRADPVWDANPYADNRMKDANWQAYLSQRLGFCDDRIQVTGGILHYADDTSSINAMTVGAVPSRLNDSHNSVLYSLLVKPWKNVAVYYDSSMNSTPALVNDAPLWRNGKQQEIGVKTEFSDQRLALNAAYFKITQTNVPVPNPEHQINLAAPVSLVSDYGDHGLEFEVSGAVTRNLSIMGSFTHLRLRDKLGRRVRAVGNDNGALLVNYRFKGGALDGLSINASAVYAGSRTGDTPSPNFTALGVVTQPSFTVPAHVTCNCGASYHWQNLFSRLYINNLTGKKDYIQQVGGRFSGTGMSTATGINVKFSITVEF